MLHVLRFSKIDIYIVCNIYYMNWIKEQLLQYTALSDSPLLALECMHLPSSLCSCSSFLPNPLFLYTYPRLRQLIYILVNTLIEIQKPFLPLPQNLNWLIFQHYL